MRSLFGGQVKHENLPSNNINTYSPQSLYSLLGRANASKHQLFKVEILPLSTSLMPNFSVSHNQWFEKNCGQLVEQFFDDKLMQSSFFLRTIDDAILFLVMEMFEKGSCCVSFLYEKTFIASFANKTLWSWYFKNPDLDFNKPGSNGKRCPIGT